MWRCTPGRACKLILTLAVPVLQNRCGLTVVQKLPQAESYSDVYLLLVVWTIGCSLSSTSLSLSLSSLSLSLSLSVSVCLSPSLVGRDQLFSVLSERNSAVS